MPPPDSFDLEALLAGDPDAFAALVRQESDRLYRVIVRIVRDDDEAQSLLQETFLQAYQRLGTFRRESKLTTWLYAIGINLARGSLRKRKRYDTYAEEDIERLQPAFRMGVFYADEYAPWSPHQGAVREERRRLVHDALARLPSDYQTVIVLRDLEERSTAEAAEILGISPGAVRVRLHRARQALRALLDRHLGPDPDISDESS